jgi:lipoprotein signal peptidase
MLSLRDVCLISRVASFYRISSAGAADDLDAGERRHRTRQRVLVLALLAAVVAADQATKWWAWRHISGTRINPGGDAIVGRTVGAWYANPAAGALLDLLDVALLSTALSVLARWRSPTAVHVLGALMIGGWGSNLLDRLGLHYWSAPGSVRGAVDYIHLGRHYYNLADFFIIATTPLLLLVVGYQGVRAARRGAVPRTVPLLSRTRLVARARIAALAGAGLIVVVALGAVNYGGVNAAPRTQSRSSTRPRAEPLPGLSGRAMPSTLTASSAHIPAARSRQASPEHL